MTDKNKNHHANLSLVSKLNLEKDTVLKPTDYLRWAAEEKNLLVPTLPNNCVFAFDPELLEAFSDICEVKERTDWPATHSKIYEAKTTQFRFLIIVGTVGAPFASMTMEELISCGVKRFLSAGACGLIQDNISSPAIIIANEAIRDEGTSFHYIEADYSISLCKDNINTIKDCFVKNSIKPIVGKVWTTDALYRETVEKVKLMKKNNVLAVEMEIAALAAVSTYRKVDYVGLLYALDNLASGKAKFPDSSRKDLTDKSLFAKVCIEYFCQHRDSI